MVLKICILRHPWMVFSSLFSYLVLKLHCWPNRLGEHLPPVPSLQMPVLSEYENFWKMTRKCKDPHDERVTHKNKGLHPPSDALSHHLPADKRLVQSPKDREAKGWAVGGGGTSLQPQLGHLGISAHQHSRHRGRNVFPQSPHIAPQMPLPSPRAPRM